MYLKQYLFNAQCTKYKNLGGTNSSNINNTYNAQCTKYKNLGGTNSVNTNKRMRFNCSKYLNKWDIS